MFFKNAESFIEEVVTTFNEGYESFVMLFVLKKEVEETYRKIVTSINSWIVQQSAVKEIKKLLESKSGHGLRRQCKHYFFLLDWLSLVISKCATVKAKVDITHKESMDTLFVMFDSYFNNSAWKDKSQLSSEVKNMIEGQLWTKDPNVVKDIAYMHSYN